MNWFKKLIPSKIRTYESKRRDMPEGLWSKCSVCQSFLISQELERNMYVCPKCDHHMRIKARDRLNLFLDSESAKVEIGADLQPIDRLKFKDTKKYKDRIVAAQKKSEENDALISFRGKLKGLDVVACAFEFSFIGGSMGTVVGEKFARSAELCLEKKIPLICFSTSGGARMQESLFSLLQMNKTSAVIGRLKMHNIPYISVMADPCTGGVSASLAMLGDVNIAEPKALIGFAGPRVIQQTVRENLPEGFQRSEFLLEKGAVDFIADRREMRDSIYNILSILLHK